MVRALLLDGNIGDLEQAKPGVRNIPVNGAAVYHWSLPKAILTHGSYERYYFVDYNGTGGFEGQTPDWILQNQHRIRWIARNQFDDLKQVEELVLMTRGTLTFPLALLRQRLGRPEWPIVGVIHSVHGSSLLNGLIANILSGGCGQNAFFCSSEAGRRVIQHTIEFLNEHLGCISKAVRYPIVPMGTDVAWFGQPKDAARVALSIPDVPVLLYFGRLSTKTKCDLIPLLRCVAEIVHSGSDLLLIIAGNDQQEHIGPAIKSAANTLGLRDNVIIRQNSDATEKRNLFAAADIFVSPSDNTQETFGISIVEAMAAGLPVIASDWSGYREIVQHGHTGFLVPAYLPSLDRDLFIIDLDQGKNAEVLAEATVIDVPALKQSLVTLVFNVDLRRKMGEEGRRVAYAKYDWKVVVKAYEDVWDTLIAEGWAERHGLEVSPLARLTYQQMFAHFATDLMSEEDFVQRRPEEARWKDLTLFRSSDETSLLYHAILQEFKGDAPLAIRDLAARTEQSVAGSDRALILLEIAQMLKRGALECVTKKGPT